MSLQTHHAHLNGFVLAQRKGAMIEGGRPHKYGDVSYRRPLERRTTADRLIFMISMVLGGFLTS